MHATNVYIAHGQFIRHQTVKCTQARSKDFHTHVVCALLHTLVFMKFKLSCTVKQFYSHCTDACMHAVQAYKL